MSSLAKRLRAQRERVERLGRAAVDSDPVERARGGGGEDADARVKAEKKERKREKERRKEEGDDAEDERRRRKKKKEKKRKREEGDDSEDERRRRKKKKEKKKRKKRGKRSEKEAGDDEKEEEEEDTLAPTTHPFEVDYCDHFETPAEAYAHLAPFLRWVAARAGLDDPARLRVWDPYYCAGRAARLMAAQGFPLVHNRNEDFYDVARRRAEPPHDVLVTNPAYSADHKERCIAYCASAGVPYALLLPAYVATKQYFALVARDTSPFFVVPRERYEFAHPEGTGHDTSPFFGVWFVDAGGRSAALNDRAAAEVARALPAGPGGAYVCRDAAALAAAGHITLEKRLNPKQRRKLRAKRAAAAAGLL